MNSLKGLTLVLACTAFALAGCGGGDGGRGPPRIVTTQIQSDPAFDGDIQQIAPSSYVVTQGMSPTVQSVFAGIDPASSTEYRTFLDFPLTGPGGVPGRANIDSAFLDIYIIGLRPNVGTIPIRIDLVSFQPPTLIGTDFDRGIQPALASLVISPPISQADVGTNVSIDVTNLMMTAQNLGLLDFQLRILQDLGPGVLILMEIDDSTGADRGQFAPLLTVNYF
jgi:hypothetical protein